MESNKKKTARIFAIAASFFAFFITLSPSNAQAADEDLPAPVTVDLGVEVNVDQTLSLAVSQNILRFMMSANTPTSQSLTLSAETNSYNGYTVSLNTSRDYNELKHSNTSVHATIPSITTDTTLANFRGAAWGYSTDQTGTKMFHKVPIDQTEIFVTDAPSADSYAFTVGVRTSEQTASGSYSNTLIFTAIANPEPEPIILPFDGITTMQGMTTEICTAAKVGDTERLRDIRDNKYYWVTKLADGNCWMTQNLDFDLSNTITLTPGDTDITANWTPRYSTRTSGWDWAHQNDVGSFDYGAYYIVDGKSSSTIATSSLDNYATEWHWSIGNYYNWYAATAGTGGSVTGGTAASQSICPKGWRLAPANGTASWNNMFSAVGVDASTINGPTAYIPFNGAFYGAPQNIGGNGTYWTGSSSGNNQATVIQFASNYVNIQSYEKSSGGAVRCVAR